jgi:hypothetical protein
MDIEKLYRDFSVDYATEGHRHARPGWVNTACPFCTGNPGYHLGFEQSSNHYYCWRCGWHPLVPTISKIINIADERQVRTIIKQYGLAVPRLAATPAITIRAKAHRMPSNVEPLGSNHRQYLIRRGFDPNELEKLWNLVGTGPVSRLDNLDFKHRIILPIIWNQREVSFTSRDITNKHPLRYITCPKDRELIHHKEILYGKQEAWGKTGICVEGPTDVWRMGLTSFCTFGIKYTPVQLRAIAKTFRRVAVLFDDDPQAVVQANKMVADLRFRGVDAFRVPVTGDPGGMKQEDANYLVKQII